MKRKTRFRIAIAIRDDRSDESYTVRDFLGEIGISETHLYAVLNGKRTPSDETDEAITRFIEGEMQHLLNHLLDHEHDLATA